MAMLVGCARGVGSGHDDGQDRATADMQERAKEDARNKVKEVIDRIDRDHGYKADGYAHSAAQVDGVEVMKTDGTMRNTGNGVSLVVRVHGIVQSSNKTGPLDLPVCFTFTYDRDKSGRPQDEIDCPTTPPLDIPKDPQLPGNIMDVLRTTLPSGPNATEASVRAVVDGLDLDPRIHVDVNTHYGAIGVALKASQYACVLARVTPEKVEVWSPSRVQLAPGELSCNGGTAAGGQGQTPPH